jgi:hypothetical protein
MKTIISCLIAALLVLAAFSQNFNTGISYQTILRDSNGNLLTDSLVHLQLKILAFEPDGEAVYSEHHHVSTNSFGLINLTIGSGEEASSDFEAINWGTGKHFLEISIDAEGDGEYLVIGATQFLSVPYAFHALNGIQAMTNEARDAIANPFIGMQIFNTSTNCLNYYNGFTWFETCGNCTPMPSEAFAGEDRYFEDTTVSVMLEANTPQYGSGQWSIIEGEGGAFENVNDPQTLFTGQPCQQYLLKWRISNPCGSTEDAVQIVFDAQPTVADAGEDQFFFDETTSVMLIANEPSVGEGQWCIKSGIGGIIDNPTNPNAQFSGQLNESYVLRWTIFTDCASDYDEITISFNASVSNSIQIVFDAVPTFYDFAPATLRYDKEHVLTFEQDDNLSGVYKSVFKLLHGGEPEFESGYNSPGRYFNDGFGGQVTMKASTVCWVYNENAYGNDYWAWATAGAGSWAAHVLNYYQLDTMIAEGFGVTSHGYYRNMNGLPDDLVQGAPGLMVEWLENRYGYGERPLSHVMPGSTTFNVQLWNQEWFNLGALYGVNGSGNVYSVKRMDVNISEITSPIIMGRYLIENKPAATLIGSINQLMNEPHPSWLRMYGHTITNGANFIDYFALKETFDYIEANLADELWVPSVMELMRYLHVRDKIIINQQLVGNVLTINFDESLIPDYIIKRFLTLKVTSDATIQSINITGYPNMKKGEGTQEAVIDIHLDFCNDK